MERVTVSMCLFEVGNSMSGYLFKEWVSLGKTEIRT